MRTSTITLQRPLSRRLMPLAYALVAMVGLILVLTWGALQIQVALAGFLNGESIWSKAQKQSVIALDAYAIKGDAADLANYKLNYATLMADHSARDAIVSGNYEYDAVVRSLQRSKTVAIAIPGVIFMLHHFSDAPYMREALQAWRSTDSSIAELNNIAIQLEAAYAHGKLSSLDIAQQRIRISEVNNYVEPRSKVFSREIADGAVWLGQLLFVGVLGAACIAALLWLNMARRILASVRGTEERYRLLFDSAADAIVMVDETSGRILDANRTTFAWTGRNPIELIGDRFVHLFMQSVARQPGRAASNLLLGADGSTRSAGQDFLPAL